jgi:hypothetical protein
MRHWDVCFRFSREEQPWKCRFYRFVAAQSGLELWQVIRIDPKGAFAMRNFKTKAIRDQQVDA